MWRLTGDLQGGIIVSVIHTHINIEKTTQRMLHFFFIFYFFLLYLIVMNTD